MDLFKFRKKWKSVWKKFVYKSLDNLTYEVKNDIIIKV